MDRPNDYHTKWNKSIYHLYVESGTNELIYKTERDSQTWSTDLWFPSGRRLGVGWIGSLGLAGASWNLKNGQTRSYAIQFSSVQSLSHVRLFATPWTAARQSSLSITISQSLLKPMSIESASPNMRRMHVCITESLCCRGGPGVASELPLPCAVWVLWEVTPTFPSLGSCGSFFMG